MAQLKIGGKKGGKIVPTFSVSASTFLLTMGRRRARPKTVFFSRT
jgi:hypothetical protein